MTFEIGGRYRNKHGHYIVLDIVGEKMRVRMDNGHEELLTIRIQRAIQERLQWEAQDPLGYALEQVRLCRQQLQDARARNLEDEMTRWRISLVEAQVKLCSTIRPRTPVELVKLQKYFDRAARSGESNAEHDYRNVCWACQTSVNSAANDRCSECGWLVCVDGACQCPDFALGFGGAQKQCSEQVKRLGSATFLKLVELRKQLLANVLS
jgi:hypothetical protein